MSKGGFWWCYNASSRVTAPNNNTNLLYLQRSGHTLTNLSLLSRCLCQSSFAVHNVMCHWHSSLFGQVYLCTLHCPCVSVTTEATHLDLHLCVFKIRSVLQQNILQLPFVVLKFWGHSIHLIIEQLIPRQRKSWVCCICWTLLHCWRRAQKHTHTVLLSLKFSNSNLVYQHGHCTVLPNRIVRGLLPRFLSVFHCLPLLLFVFVQLSVVNI